MKTSFQHVVKNCGNFSYKVLPGLIAYGREADKAHSFDKMVNNPGYATREHDIKIGGFLHARCAKAARDKGKIFSQLSVDEKQELALAACKTHIEKFGEVGIENHEHWMKRVRAFAKHHKIELAEKEPNESDYQYARRVRKWALEQPEAWPKIHKAVGTHLVFSPDPKMWVELRNQGHDEREFLKTVLTRTMKDLQDWRSHQYGPNRSLGWVAGTHIVEKNADRHPHIHVVVLKRDESGYEVDWSVSSIKGKKGRENEPDQIKTAKNLFKKNAEKEYERLIGKAVSTGQEVKASREPNEKAVNPLVLKKIRFLTNSILPKSHRQTQSDLGALIRLFRMYRSQIQHGKHCVEENIPTFIDFKKWVQKQFPRTKEQAIQPEI